MLGRGVCVAVCGYKILKNGGGGGGGEEERLAAFMVFVCCAWCRIIHLTDWSFCDNLTLIVFVIVDGVFRVHFTSYQD